MAANYWRVIGADRNTGKDSELTLRAESAEEAASIARGMGMLIAKIEPAPPRLVRPATRVGVGTVLVVLGVLFLAGVVAATFLKSRSDSARRASAPAADPSFVEAVRSSEIESVKLYLGRESPVNAVDDNGIPLLCIALEGSFNRGWRQVVEMLLARGADVEMRDRMGDPALSYAAREGNAEAIKLLLGQGARVDVVNNIKQGPLHTAIVFDHSECAKLLIDAGANIGAQDSEGYTPLHTAAADGSIASIRLLLASGADVNALDSKGYTPRHRAELAFRDEAAALLKQAGGKP